MKKFGVLILVMLVFSSCMKQKNPINRDQVIGGHKVFETIVFFPESRRYSDFTLPAGDYLPVAENGAGVYYEAPQQIVLKAGAFDGGIFLHYDNPSVPYRWATVWGATYIYEPIPDFIKFELRNR